MWERRWKDRIRAGLVVLAAGALYAACGGGGGGGPTQPSQTTPPVVTAALQALSVNPNSLQGGGSVTVTATLSAAAPAAGASVTLASSNPAVAVPGSLAIASGATSGTATATTSSVNATTPATITGTLAGVSQSATVNVEPPPTVARFTVVSASRGPDACQLGSGGSVDCDLNGSASTGAGAITLWSWRLVVGAEIQTFQTTTPVVRPTTNCNLFSREPASNAGGVTFVQMRVELVVRDAAGRDSAPALNSNVRVFPQQNCGRGF